jgi:hypothetical protein
MTQRRLTRRSVLKAGAGAGLLTTLAGCLDGGSSSGNGDSPSGDGTSLDAVPSGATAVVSLDTGRLLDGELVRKSVNRTLDLVQQQRSAALPVESYEQALSMAESEIGLDPTGLQSVQFFSGQTEAATGLLFEADWSEDDIVSTIESQGTVTLSSRSEDGHTIYSSEDGTDGLVALADGRFLIAESATIDSVLAVLAGDADPVGGELADAYSGTAGMMRFAADLREANLGNTGELSAMQDARVVSGSLTSSGNTRTLTVDVTTSGASAAEDMADQIDALVTLAGSQVEQYPEVQEFIENPQEHLDAVDVSQSGSTVTVSYGGSVDFVAEGGMIVLGAVVGSFVLGLGESVENTSPSVAFSMDFDTTTSGSDSFGTAASGDDEGVLTITHTSGDSVSAGDLRLMGGLAGPASWADSGVGPDAQITAGDSVDYAVASDTTVSVVWESEGNSAVLSRWSGPDA